MFLQSGIKVACLAALLMGLTCAGTVHASESPDLAAALEQLQRALKSSESTSTGPGSSESESADLHKVSIEELEELLKHEGYGSVERIRDNILRFKIDGLKVLLILCSDGDLQLHMGLTGGGHTLAQVNEWNRRMRITKAYLDSDGDIALESDLNAVAGLHRTQIVAFINTFRNALGAFKRHLQSA